MVSPASIAGMLSAGDVMRMVSVAMIIIENISVVITVRGGNDRGFVRRQPGRLADTTIATTWPLYELCTNFIFIVSFCLKAYSI